MLQIGHGIRPGETAVAYSVRRNVGVLCLGGRDLFLQLGHERLKASLGCGIGGDTRKPARLFKSSVQFFPIALLHFATPMPPERTAIDAFCSI